MTKRVSTILLYTTVSVLLTAGGLALFTQTPMFRETLRSSLYTFLESELNADIYIGEIDGNLFTGLSVDTVMMYVDGAPFVESGKLSVKYDLLDMLSSRITVDSLTLENPSVHLIRWKNGEWNVNRIAKGPSAEDSAESPLIVTARRLRLLNARFALIDSTGEIDSVYYDRNGRRSINYSDLRLDNIFIDVDGMYSASRLQATINHLSFASPRERFALLALKASVLRTKDSSVIRNASIVTPNSSLEFSAAMTGVDGFSISRTEQLRKARVALTVAPSAIQTSEIQAFLPSLDFLKGTVTFDGIMEGDFENLNVRSLNASFGGSSIALSGTVSNIHRPEELRLNIVSSNSTILPSDVPALMPYYRIPDYRNLGTLTVDLQFVGKPLDFLAMVKVRSDAGTVTVDGEMMITEENLHYKGIVDGKNVNLERVFASDELFSRLNTRVFIEGVGTSLATLSAEATVEIDSSMFRNIAIDASRLRIAARDQKVETELSARSPEGSVTAQAFVDFADDSLPAYALTAAVRGLNLAPIIRDDYYTSNLSFDLQRSGQGLTLFENPSETKIDLYRSNFHGMAVESARVALQWLKDSSNGDHVTLQSPVADAALQGNFTFNGLLQAVQAHLEGFGKMYDHQRRIMDSSFAMEMDTAFVRDTIRIEPGIFTYDLTLKDLRPISVFFDFPELQLVGTAKGRITATKDVVSSSGEIAIAKGWYADTSQPMTLKNVRLDYSVQNIVPAAMTPFHDSLELKLHVQGDEYLLDSTAFRLASIDLDYARQFGAFTVASDIDTTLSFSADGTINVSDLTDTVRFRELSAKYQGLDLRIADPFLMKITSDGVHVDSVLFIRRDEEIFLSGNVNFQGIIDAVATVRNFDLSDIFFINTSHSYREQAMKLGGKIDLSARFGGTARNPVITAQLEGKDISYEESRFGDLEAALKYARKKAAIKVELREPDTVAVPQLFDMEGVVPIDLSFLPVEERLDFSGMDLRITTGNLSASIFDIFVPEIDRMSGRIGGGVMVTGSLVKPELKGEFLLDSGLFRLEMNGIHYQVRGSIALDSGKMTFPEFTLRNLPDDYTDGLVRIGGYITMDGFAPAEYHLTANGELLALNNQSRTPNQAFFGRMVAQTGAKGLRFEGRFERSRIIGDIIVDNAFLTFPPAQREILFAGARFDEIIFIDDTSSVIVDTVTVEAPPVVIAPVAAPVRSAERTFLDGFGYELTIETRSNVRVQMIFNANAGAYEELVAELNGKTTLKKDEAGQQLTGTINVGEGSNYKYYKEFKASGSLTFVGDPQNPQLNILAKYRGVHLKVPGDNTTEEGVVVSLEITGTRLTPKVKLGLSTVDLKDPNNRETPRQGDVENDAIAFLLTSSQNEPGFFREELANVDRNKLGAQLNEAISGTFVNNLLSGLVNDFITKNNIPYVKRVEVRNVTSEADINTTLEVSDAVINIGGKVFTDVNNTNVSVQVPVLGRQNRNFIFEVEKRTENADYTSIQARNILGARLFYRFTF